MIADSEDRERRAHITADDLEFARKAMALGGSLMDAAMSIGVGRDELDQALWSRITWHKNPNPWRAYGGVMPYWMKDA